PRGNRRTTKEGDSDLKFQNFSLSKNRSWPRINTVTGQYQTIREPLLDWERNFSTVRDEAEGCRDEDYEDPELHMAQMWQTMRILPTQPLKESDYADTRYFIDTPLSFYTNNSVAMDGQAWKTRMGLKEVERPIAKDFRNQHGNGDHPMRENKGRIPLPPPRPPVTLPKRYQPLPPEPESSRPSLPLRHTIPVPECPRQPSQINLKNLSEDTLHGEWYIGEHSRQAVEEALMKENKDGTFLVRDCSKKSRAEPYVLAVFYGNKVYNVKIRFLERSLQFALGTGLRGDEKFNSVEAIIEHYKHSPIILIDGKDKTGFHREQCYLTQPLPFRRHFSPRAHAHWAQATQAMFSENICVTSNWFRFISDFTVVKSHHSGAHHNVHCDITIVNNDVTMDVTVVHKIMSITKYDIRMLRIITGFCDITIMSYDLIMACILVPLWHHNPEFSPHFDVTTTHYDIEIMHYHSTKMCIIMSIMMPQS
ncbi:cytokine-dependent hematopoietic cell linker, partial [Suncus etruscus]|uniref:cytokine-dependent hematopoietic cell linker n=1 Tax=Suncus etruscus TaxID=109475 RepID=UPI00210FC525